MSDAWTTRSLLAWIEPHLERKGVDAARVVARHLVAEALQCDVMELFTDADRSASPAEREALRPLVEQAAAGKPLQQILGRTMFSFREFEVTSDVLSPRDATESLVRAVLTWHRGVDPDERPDPLLIADIGTGSGCVGVTLAADLETAWVLATDVSADALAVAERNIERHGLGGRVITASGTLLEPLAEPVHVIVSNPPYIPDADWAKLDDVVRLHDPPLALKGGVDGLDVIRPLVAAAPDRLLDGGLLALETCTSHAWDVAALCTQAGLSEAKVLKDAWGDERIVTATKPFPS